MGTWKEPLHYQVTKLTGMPGANETLLSTAKNIEAQSKELLELTKWILNMVNSLLKSPLFSFMNQTTFVLHILKCPNLEEKNLVNLSCM